MELTITPKEFRLLQKAEEVLNRNGFQLETFSNFQVISRGQHSKIEVWVSRRALIPEKEKFEHVKAEFKEETGGSEIRFAGIWSHL